MKKPFVRTEENSIKSMKSMMDSLYAYHSLSKDSKYLADRIVELGEELFNKTYDEYETYLKETFKVVDNTGTCVDGLTYNSLVKK